MKSWHRPKQISTDAYMRASAVSGCESGDEPAAAAKSVRTKWSPAREMYSAVRKLSAGSSSPKTMKYHGG